MATRVFETALVNALEDSSQDREAFQHLRVEDCEEVDSIA